MRSLFCSLALVGALVLPLAAQDMPLSQLLVPDQGWELVVEGFEFCDGLATDAEGKLYFSDVRSGTAVYQVDLEGKVSEFIAEAPGISGLKWGADGRLYACVSREERVVVFEKDKSMKELATGVRPNDLVVTHEGAVYFTVTRSGEICRIDPSGKMSVVSAGVIGKPNGIALTRDQGTLAVSDSGSKYAWTFRIEADGSLADGERYMSLVPPVATPEVAKGDGMTTDVHGRYYVTSAEGLQVFDPTGRLCGVLLSPEPTLPVVSVAFAGPGHSWLYLANGGKIWRRPTQTSGALSFVEPKGYEAPPKKS